MDNKILNPHNYIDNSRPVNNCLFPLNIKPDQHFYCNIKVNSNFYLENDVIIYVILFSGWLVLLMLIWDEQMTMKTLRVFPRKMKSTPDDPESIVGDPVPNFRKDFDLIKISVTFTWDKEKAYRLAERWEKFGKVEIGGPAFDDPGGDFTPGLFLKPGYAITSRGCPNNCWFCLASKREGNIRELPIKDGWDVLDNNLLACSDSHVKSVFEMLLRQKERVKFTGGLDVSLLKDWHVDYLSRMRLESVYFAYDSPGDLEILVETGRKLRGVLLPRVIRCYVLIGYPGDTINKAEVRLNEALEAGFIPMAMLYRGGVWKREINRDWHDLAFSWINYKMLAYRIKRLKI